MPSEMFSALSPSSESRKRRGAAFVGGLFVQALMIGAALLVGILFPERLPVNAKQYVMIWLPSLTPPPAPAPAVKPQPEVVRVVMPKMKPPVLPEPPAPRMADLEIPKLRPTPSPVTIRTPQPPIPSPVFARPTPTPKVQAEVHTGTFGGGPEPITTQRPANQVQTGGFGNPQGLPGLAQGNNPGNVPKLGSFGLPEGPGVGNGTGGAHGIQGVVASAGFGSGVAGSRYVRGGDGTGGPRVTTGGFEKVAQVTPIATRNYVQHAVQFQPVEILSKPFPLYTDEARHLGIQGEVALSVVFEATGAIRVVGVVKSLGYGLDQAAEQAAAQIRFKPALRDGKPADFPATLRIQFRLADQST